MNLLINNIGHAINDGAFKIGTVFAGARNAIDQLRNKTEGMCTHMCASQLHPLKIPLRIFVWILSDI